jgi:phosphoglycerate kinase
MIQSIEDADFLDKRVLVRVDLNVPIENGIITDDIRIEESLPTIDQIIDKGGIPILMSHLGRPDGKFVPKLSLEPIANYLKDHFGYKIIFSKDCIGQTAKDAVNKAELGEVILLENLRFHPEEEANDEGFAKQLAELGDCYVNDAFGTAHRAHASTSAVAKLFENRYAGDLMIKELDYLGKTLNNPVKPFVAVIGGAKISGKIDVIRSLFEKCDSILIGGGMMFTFYKAMGLNIGKSILEADKVHLAEELIEKAKSLKINLLLPVDAVVADKFDNASNFRTVDINSIHNDDIGMDIGEKSIEIYSEIILKAKTVFWNGPMGVFEMDNFAKGTYAIAKALAEVNKRGGISIVGGGDSSAAISEMKLEKQITHVSTGGGASLEFLEGQELPGLLALEK